MTIRVALADDHKMFREALRAMLQNEPDIEVVGEAGDGEALLKLAARAAPDIVLMDIGMAGLNGIDTTRQLTGNTRTIRVLALSTYVERYFILQMLNAGASGYVVKSAGRAELLEGIRRVAQGKQYLSSEAAAALGDNTLSPGIGRELAGAHLARREREVLQLVAEGNSSQQIAARLHIAATTVEVHRRNIMRKLNLHSVAELTKHAIRLGLTSG